MELSGPAPLGAAAALAQLPQQRRATDVKPVVQAENSAGAGSDTRQRPEQDQTASVARQMADAAANSNAMAKGDGDHAGPPPSFEVSLLEMESDLKQVIARIEQSRAQKANAEAIQTKAESDEHARQAAQAKEPDMVQETKPGAATVAGTAETMLEAGATYDAALEAPEEGAMAGDASATVAETTQSLADEASRPMVDEPAA